MHYLKGVAWSYKWHQKSHILRSMTPWIDEVSYWLGPRRILQWRKLWIIVIDYGDGFIFIATTIFPRYSNRSYFVIIKQYLSSSYYHTSRHPSSSEWQYFHHPDWHPHWHCCWYYCQHRLQYQYWCLHSIPWRSWWSRWWGVSWFLNKCALALHIENELHSFSHLAESLQEKEQEQEQDQDQDQE